RPVLPVSAHGARRLRLLPALIQSTGLLISAPGFGDASHLADEARGVERDAVSRRFCDHPRRRYACGAPGRGADAMRITCGSPEGGRTAATIRTFARTRHQPRCRAGRAEGHAVDEH